MERQYNTRSPAVKRLMKEAQELSKPTYQYYAQPLDDNLFEWHFTVRGPGDSDFEGGVYHGRIVLPTEYPMKPPNIIVLTPNGRFEVGKKICLSISGHHPESWQPSWSIRTALLAIIGFMPTPGQGTIGSLDYSSDERKRLAQRSVNFACDTCGQTTRLLKDENDELNQSSDEMKEIMEQIAFKSEEEVKEDITNLTENDSADLELSDEQREKIERKKKSLAAEQRFRKRMNLPQKKSASIPNFDAASDIPRPAEPRRQFEYQQQPSRGRVQANNEDDRWSLADYLIAAIVVVIGVIFFKRINGGFFGTASDTRPDNL